MNKIIITGNVGSDLVLETSPKGVSYTKFSMGVSIGTKDKPLTQWYNVVVFGQRAEMLINYVTKGSKLLVEGNLAAKAYINKNNQANCDLTVTANSVEFINIKQDKQDKYFDESQQATSPADGCPF